MRSPLIHAVFLFHFITFVGGLPAYFSNHSAFSRGHIFVGFNEFPSLMCWCTVIHHHRQQGPTLFRRVRWDFMCMCSVLCAQTQDLLFCHIREDYVMQLVLHPRGLQQNKHWEWESNLCPSESTGSQVQLTTPRLPRLYKVLSTFEWINRCLVHS